MILSLFYTTQWVLALVLFHVSQRNFLTDQAALEQKHAQWMDR